MVKRLTALVLALWAFAGSALAQDPESAFAGIFRGKLPGTYPYKYNGTYYWDRPEFQQGDVFYNGRLYRDISINIDACEGEGIREEKLKELIVSAFNLLPFELDELVKMRRQINEETLVKADVILKGLKSQIRGIEEAEVAADTDELISLNTQYTAVSRKRAEFACRERQIRDLLERIDFIEDREPEGVTVGPACGDETEFYRRTRRLYPMGLVTEYTEDDVVRFVERIVIYKEKIEVEFKAGVTVSVDR